MKPGQDIAPVYLSELDEQRLSSPLLVKLAGDVLARGAPLRFRAGGSSMFPFVRDGDIISMVAPPEQGPVLGDVMAFRLADGEHLAVHRVVGKAAGCFLLKGDNYPRGHLDGPVSKDHLLGIVSRVERKGRRVRLGLGPERRLIALCSRLNLLQPLVGALAALYRPCKKIRAFLVLPTKPVSQSNDGSR